MRGAAAEDAKMADVNVCLKRLLPCSLLVLAALPGPLLHAASTRSEETAGAVLFRDKGCAHCHGDGGLGGKKGPSLSDLRTNRNWPPAKIKEQILNGGQKMPPFGDSMTDEEIAQVIAYLRAKHRPVPPATPAATPAQ
jgi:mono/diheme cytochrome c family protein